MAMDLDGRTDDLSCEDVNMGDHVTGSFREGFITVLLVKYYPSLKFRSDRELFLLRPARVVGRRCRTSAGSRVLACRRRVPPKVCRPPTLRILRTAHTTRAHARLRRRCAGGC